MAEIIYGTVSNILSNLASDAFQELGGFFRANKDLKKFQDTLGTVKAFLVDAEQAAESSESAKNWINRLQDVVYDADDLLDEFRYEHLRQKAHSAAKVTLVQNLFSSLTTLPFRLTMHSKVKEIRERLDDVAVDIKKLGFKKIVMKDMRVGNSRRETDSSVGVGNTWSWRETDSLVVKSEIIGRDENKKDIINLLLEKRSNQSDVSIVAIVGFGGLGKTTLAQLVYNEIENHFSRKIWVCVSDQFDIRLLIKNILKSLPEAKKEVDDLNLEQLQRELRKVLGGKRYLIVLDDVWNDDSLKWDKFSKYLLDGAPGSKILVTTRNRSVALAMGINSPYVLEGLNSDQSWDLFRHVAFRGQNEINRKLELIGKEVVGRCKGFPLAIKTLASWMREKPNESFWSSIEVNEVWKSVNNKEGIFSILKLSYDHLPSHLKPCFAFCSIFPKDFVIYKDRLIRLWNAQGYIQPSIRNQRSVDLGDQYYNDLLSRSFFQEEKKYEDGNITCKMHDLIHDLAQLVVGSSFYTVKDDNETIPGNVRHLFLECNLSQKFPKIPIKGIRTILKSDNDHYHFRRREVIQIPSFSNLSCSRVLDFRCADIKMLPNEIGRLKHLRSLDLSGTLIEVVPDFITKLHNLQTLLLDSCENLKKLPKDIRKLISLECLGIEDCDKLNYLPKGLGELTSLHRLDKFIVNSDEEDSATLNELRDLNYLGGKLVIENLDMVRNVELESNEANLKEKKHLESLKLKWRYRQDIDKKDDELLLNNLKPHPNLKKLVIEGFQGTMLSSWLSSLTNLVRLEIEGRYCQQLPHLNHLPSLEFLRLGDLRALEYVVDDGIGKECSTTSTTATMFFPSLKELELSYCYDLEGWWNKNENEGATSELPCFPCLSSLRIIYCPNLTSMPLFPSLDGELQLYSTSIRPLQQTLMMKTNNTSAASASSASASSSRNSSTAPPLSNLKNLTLGFIGDVVETLPEEFLLNLTSLEYLHFAECNKLKSLAPRSTHCLPSLKELRLSFCPELTASPEWISTLTSFKTLVIGKCSQLPSMPGGICRLTSLEELVFYECDNLTALTEWIPALTSLNFLQIGKCPLLPSLPGGMHRLTSLRELIIRGCPKLTETCKEESGTDWPQIAQIPNICIDGRWVRGKAELEIYRCCQLGLC